jgi:hypothetical protein
MISKLTRKKECRISEVKIKLHATLNHIAAACRSPASLFLRDRCCIRWPIRAAIIEINQQKQMMANKRR